MRDGVVLGYIGMRLVLICVGLLGACSQRAAQDSNAKAQDEPARQPVQSTALNTAPALPPASLDDAAVPPAERRLEPAPGWNPSHATLRLLRKIGEGDWTLTPFINAKRGVFVYRESLSWQENTAVSELFCPPLSRSQTTQLLSFFKLVDKRLEDATGTDMASCKNTPRPPRCTSQMTGEYESSLSFFFADGVRGIELDAIFEIDMEFAATNTEVIGAKKLRSAEAAWKKARLGGCQTTGQ
tara:strand:+ start:8421 stop:9143 length:723 start_codon:yes stop_codon:yes gene_type:complete